MQLTRESLDHWRRVCWTGTDPPGRACSRDPDLGWERREKEEQMHETWYRTDSFSLYFTAAVATSKAVVIQLSMLITHVCLVMTS